ncbi:MAG: RDD family protein, partial [bacterium]|nr:RDD family protein [bacterium]
IISSVILLGFGLTFILLPETFINETFFYIALTLSLLSIGYLGYYTCIVMSIRPKILLTIISVVIIFGFGLTFIFSPETFIDELFFIIAISLSFLSICYLLVIITFDFLYPKCKIMCANYRKQATERRRIEEAQRLEERLKEEERIRMQVKGAKARWGNIQERLKEEERIRMQELKYGTTSPYPPTASSPSDRPEIEITLPKSTPADVVGKTCPFCQFPIKPGDNPVICSYCGIPHHHDCWQENRGCTTFGCHGAGQPYASVSIATAYPQTTTSTPAYTGEATKRCTYCGKIILAAAVKCKYCKSIITPTPQYYDGAIAPSYNSAVPVGFWIRLGAYFIDGICTTLISYFCGLILGIVFGISEYGGGGLSQSDVSGIEALAQLFGLIITVSYHTLLIGKYGQTLGKMAVGIQVVQKDGGPVSYARACGRYFSYFISAIPCGLGFLEIAFREDKRGWHDMIAGTKVIRKSGFSSSYPPPSSTFFPKTGAGIVWAIVVIVIIILALCRIYRYRDYWQ